MQSLTWKASPSLAAEGISAALITAAVCMCVGVATAFFSSYSVPTKLVFAGRPLGWIINGFFTWLHKPTNDMIDKKGYISVLDDDDIWGPQYEGVDLSADEDLFGEENAGGEENALHDGDTNSGSGKVRLLA